MNLTEFLIIVLATFALSVIVILLFRLLTPPHVAVMTHEDTPARWWPWPITSYNHWPYWMGGNERVHHERNSPKKEGEHARPWGGAQRGANGGGFHHGSAPPAPSAPPVPSAPSSPSK